MKPVIMAAVTVVTLALTFYSIGIFLEQKKRRVTLGVIRALTIGVVLDITATVLMIAGSENTPYSIHGMLGYSSLAAMLTDTVLAWRHRLNHGDEPVPRWLHVYSRIAYIWWVAAFVTGGLLVAMNHPT